MTSLAGANLFKYSQRKFLNINLQLKFRVHVCTHLYSCCVWYSLKPLKRTVWHSLYDFPWNVSHDLLAKRHIPTEVHVAYWTSELLLSNLFPAFLTKLVCARHGWELTHCSVENQESQQLNIHKKGQNQLDSNISMSPYWIFTNTMLMNEWLACCHQGYCKTSSNSIGCRPLEL